jgi:hypothetical protein
MNRQISDEELERTLRQLFAETAVDDATIDDIAGSPNIWRQVRRNINEAQPAVSPWPPVGKWLRWLAIAVPAAAAVALTVGVVWFRASYVPASVAVVPPASIERTAPQLVTDPPAASVTDEAKTLHTTVTPIARRPPAKSKPVKTKTTRRVDIQSTEPTAPAAAPIKTEFIALTLARDPDSGQIVRVKVPSSMMVSLGLVESVTKPNDLVDAEVLVGDDGLTRAIRFIR